MTIETLAQSLAGEKLSSAERGAAADFLAALTQGVAGEAPIATVAWPHTKFRVTKKTCA
jgi:hypothetical protein